jgi:type II secretory pathway component GspD/PulD (secretin)
VHLHDATACPVEPDAIGLWAKHENGKIRWGSPSNRLKPRHRAIAHTIRVPIMPNSVLALVLATCIPATAASAATPTLRAAPQSKAHQHQAPKPAAKADTVQVIALEFAQASDVAKHLKREMKLGRRSSALMVVPHPGSNSLLLRGTDKYIAAANDLIARADLQPAFRKKGSMTQFVIIENGKAKDIADTLNRFLQTSSSSDLRIEAHAPNNMVLLRGTKSRIVDSLDLIAQLDRKPSKTQIAPQFVFLEHTKAAEVAATLNRFLDLSEQDGPNRGFFIDANKGRNAVILRGTAHQVREALDLIARLDIQAPSKKGQATRTVVLKHAQAKDLADTLKRFAGPTTAHGIEVRYSKKENALLIQGQEKRMQQVLKLIQKLDTAPATKNAK